MNSIQSLCNEIQRNETEEYNERMKYLNEMTELSEKITPFEDKLKTLCDNVEYRQDINKSEGFGWYNLIWRHPKDKKNNWGYERELNMGIIVGHENNEWYISGFSASDYNCFSRIKFSSKSKMFLNKESKNLTMFMNELEYLSKIMNEQKNLPLEEFPRNYYPGPDNSELVGKMEKFIKLEKLCKERNIK